ncbi:conserved hypothetical protein [Rhodococcus jostii RHA1]|uniref:Uncharacterized protein n=1 Tax=Rhodococcus jostii (strain RHA1) TaxID=101510 RepID=Q0SHE3_RHOJR|nr:conserved hypothetical protein [Rhodococcus jostii RHA1]
MREYSGAEEPTAIHSGKTKGFFASARAWGSQRAASMVMSTLSRSSPARMVAGSAPCSAYRTLPPISSNRMSPDAVPRLTTSWAGRGAAGSGGAAAGISVTGTARARSSAAQSLSWIRPRTSYGAASGTRTGEPLGSATPIRVYAGSGGVSQRTGPYSASTSIRLPGPSSTTRRVSGAASKPGLSNATDVTSTGTSPVFAIRT